MHESIVVTSVHCSARTEKLVVDYEQKLEHFMDSTTLHQFKKLFPALATPFMLSDGKTRIIFKLQNWWGDDTILDLKKLVNRLGISGECLHLSKVDEGCVAVTWLCSTSNTEELKSDINRTAKLLGTVGVIQVLVGEEVVFDCLNQKPLEVGIDLPKIIPLISKLLEKYPDGGQILKVNDVIQVNIIMCNIHTFNTIYMYRLMHNSSELVFMHNILLLPYCCNWLLPYKMIIYHVITGLLESFVA